MKAPASLKYTGKKKRRIVGPSGRVYVLDPKNREFFVEYDDQWKLRKCDDIKSNYFEKRDMTVDDILEWNSLK